MLITALAAVMPTASSAESIAEKVAPGMEKYGKDYKFPTPECEKACKDIRDKLNGIGDKLKKFDSPEWKNWWDAAAKLKAKEDAFKPFQDKLDAKKATLDQKKEALTGASEAAKAAGKKAYDLGLQKGATKADKDAANTAAKTAQGKEQTAKTEQGDAQKAFNEENKKANESKEGQEKNPAKTEYDKAEGKLKGNKAEKAANIKEIRELAEKAKKTLEDLEECLKQDICKKKEPLGPTGHKIPDPSKIELPTVCPGPSWTPAQKDDYDKKSDAARMAITTQRISVRKIIAELTQDNRPLTPEAQKEMDAAKAALKKLDELEAELNKLDAEANKKILKQKAGIDCPDESITEEPIPDELITQQRSGTITVVIATDSGEYSGEECTYGDGIAVYTAITVTDEAGTAVTISEETTTTPEGTPTISEGTPTPTEATPETSTPSEEARIPSAPAPETPELAEKLPEQPPTTPETPELTEKVPEQPPTTPETPALTEKVPEPPPTTPETPELTEKVPEQPPSQLYDTIFFKGEQAVLKAKLEGEPTGESIESELVKLFTKDEPELPGKGIKEAEDTGFDKDPVQCKTGADGECKMQVPVEDRAQYGLPSTGEKPGNYRVDVALPKQSGGVAETTGRRTKPDLKTGTPDGAEVTEEEFKIGDRSFNRVEVASPYGMKHDFHEQYTAIYGSKYEKDPCRESKPGLPLAMQPDSLIACRDKQPALRLGTQPGSLIALHHDLPEATVKLGGAVPTPGDTP